MQTGSIRRQIMGVDITDRVSIQHPMKAIDHFPRTLVFIAMSVYVICSKHILRLTAFNKQYNTVNLY